MILYDSTFASNFSDYGIKIPIKYDRVQRCYDYLVTKLSENSFLKEDRTIPEISRDDLLLVHAQEYVDQLLGSTPEEALSATFEDYYEPKSGKLLAQDFVKRVLLQTKGSYQAMLNSLEHRFVYFLGGGMHHAMSFSGRGFCLINDIVIGIRKLQKQNKIKTAWIVDVDAHKGDGCAEVTQNDSTISTLSIHMKDGWPLDQPQKESLIASTVDIPVPPGGETEYINLLQEGLDRLNGIAPTPDLVVVVNGADPFEEDLLPSASLLKLSLDQMLQRDQLLYQYFSTRNIPQTYLIAGGYGDQVWKVYAQFIESVYS